MFPWAVRMLRPVTTVVVKAISTLESLGSSGAAESVPSAACHASVQNPALRHRHSSAEGGPEQGDLLKAVRSGKHLNSMSACAPQLWYGRQSLCACSHLGAVCTVVHVQAALVTCQG